MIFSALQQAGQLAGLGLGGLHRRELPGHRRLNGGLERGGVPHIRLPGLERGARLGAENLGDHAVSSVAGQDVGTSGGEFLPQADLVRVGLHAACIAQHRRHGVEAALGLVLDGGQIRDLTLAALFRALRASELFHRSTVGHRRLLLLDDRLVVVLREDLSLRLKVGQLGVGGSEPFLLPPERGGALVYLVLRGLDLARGRHRIAGQFHAQRRGGQPGRRQQTASGYRPCGPARAEVTPQPVSHPVPRNRSSFPRHSLMRHSL